MNTNSTSQPEVRDPLGLNFVLRRALASDFLPETIGNPDELGEESRQAVVSLAYALGRCRLTDAEIDPQLDGSLTLPMGVVAAEEATRQAEECLARFEDLLQYFSTRPASPNKDDEDGELEMAAWETETDEGALQIMERRLALLALAVILEEAFYSNAGDENREMVLRLRDQFGRFLKAVWNLDQVLVESLRILLPIRGTNLLENWRALLPPRRAFGAKQWWFFDEERWTAAEQFATA